MTSISNLIGCTSSDAILIPKITGVVSTCISASTELSPYLITSCSLKSGLTETCSECLGVVLTDIKWCESNCQNDECKNCYSSYSIEEDTGIVSVCGVRVGEGVTGFRGDFRTTTTTAKNVAMVNRGVLVSFVLLLIFS